MSQASQGKVVSVLGGGISGLSLAWFLRQLLPASTHINLFESTGRVGGWVKTYKKKDDASASSYLFEAGPRGFRPSRNGNELLQLIQELKLEDQVIMSSSEAAARYIYGGKTSTVNKVPTSLLEAFQWDMFSAVLKGILKEPFVARTSAADESIYDFIARRFNVEIAEGLIDPMASGIFGGDIKTLSVRACFKLLWDYEQEYGSILKAMWRRRGIKPEEVRLMDGTLKSDFILTHEKALSVSFKDGMETLTEALRRQLMAQDNVTLHLSTRVQSLALSHQERVIVTVDALSHTTASSTFESDHVFSALPAPALAALLPPEADTLATQLRSIGSVDMGVVSLGYDSNAILPHDSRGFGYLVPSKEHQDILGVVYDSVSFPTQNNAPEETRLSVMMGGAHAPWIQTATPAELQRLARASLKQHLGIVASPCVINCLTIKEAIPQYLTGHPALVQAIRSEGKRVMPALTLLGNYFDGVGVSDCVGSAKQLALEFVAP